MDTDLHYAQWQTYKPPLKEWEQLGDIGGNTVVRDGIVVKKPKWINWKSWEQEIRKSRSGALTQCVQKEKAELITYMLCGEW